MSTDVCLALLAWGALAFGAGWAWRNIQLARGVERPHEATRAGHRRLYATMTDGRSADRYEPGRYADGNR